ncbi:DUF397 domain-containing protein [Pseudofrankia inefficax]|uniref:DUF397 domain-containing protein n=1 Tax=Pseudofrankia inefficax (strain DSM 45817 / CECT 9037 / DDB 130130 / EuI1c) TaxID=298654 RepID=E3IZK8_PSEI1|nr:protein of unknown function DUF397 [Pseudofrankia inefficax]
MVTNQTPSRGSRLEAEAGGDTKTPSPLEWRRTSFCGIENACVDVAFASTGIAMRDSKDPAGPVLLFTTTEWAAFLRGVHNGEFELPRGELERPGC